LESRFIIAVAVEVVAPVVGSVAAVVADLVGQRSRGLGRAGFRGKMAAGLVEAAGSDSALRLARAAERQVAPTAEWPALPVRHRPPGHRAAAIATRAV